MTQTATSFACPACDAPCEANNVQYVGEIMACDACHEELEVTSLEPVAAVVAPEPEEDWGE